MPVEPDQQEGLPQPPDLEKQETELRALLGNFHPTPSPRFYQRMQAAPWMSQARRQAAWLRPLAITVMVIALLAGLTAATPALRGAAGRLIHYFWPAPTDTLKVPVRVGPDGSWLSSQPGDFSLSLEQVRGKAGFPVKELSLSSLPANVSFTGARLDPTLEAAFLRYDCPEYILFFNQHKLGMVEEYSSIGASAVVEKVSLRGQSGEYVTGGWRFVPGANNSPALMTPTEPVSLGVFWDPDLPQSILRWQESGVAYEILLNGQKVDKSFMIKLAEGIK